MAKDFVGEIIRVDLGISHEKYTYGFKNDSILLEESDLQLPTRAKKTTHKGNFGHLAVITGEKEGASILSALASLHFGVGLATMVGDIHTPLPLEIMEGENLPYNTTAIALGMGYGDEFKNILIHEVLDNNVPIVLDADIFHSETLLDFLEQNDREIVLTPHPKEFVAMWNMTIEEPLTIPILQANRFEKVKEFSTLFPNITLLLKGANMIIAKDNNIFVNPHGSSKLSKGGSGDVLSGLIGALLAQGYTDLDATIHSSLALTAGAKNYIGASYAMLPTNLIEEIGKLEKDSCTV
jgi:hydroxyethylthiazole kinase-like uncharacterized protein yjeF